MSRKAKTADDGFDTIDREIGLLLRRLRNVCPCCVAKAMLSHGAFLHQEIAGAAETVAMCRDIADSIEHMDDVGVPVGGTQH